jgi:O-antigen/teichoic acid export membrane protein
MILTRTLEKHDLGIYVLILALIQLISLLSGLGLEISVVKFIAGNESARKDVLLPVCLMKSILLIAASGLFYAGGKITLDIFGQEIADYFLIIPVVFIAAGIRDLFYNILQGLNYFRKYAFAQILGAALRVGLILLVIIKNDLTLSNLIYIELITTAGAAFFQAFLIPFKKFLHFPGWDTYRMLLKFSFPLYMNNVLTFVYDRVNIFIIGAFLNTASIALYDVAGRIPDAFKKIYQSFIVVYYPNIAKLFSQDKKNDALRLMNKSLSFSSVILAFITLFSFFFGKEIITLLFSDTYKESAFAFSVLMLNFYIRALSNLLGYTLVSAGYSSVPVKVNIVSSIISVGGSIILIPLIGFTGAVYSLLAMNISSLLLFNYHLSKRDMKPNSFEYYKPAIFIIALGLLSFLMQVEELPLKILFLILYLIAGWIWLNGVKEIFKFFTGKIKLKSL